MLFCASQSLSIILWTETPTCLCLCLECLSVSFCLSGLSSCPTQMDRTIRSCLLASVTTRASRHNSAPSGLSTCPFWAPLQVRVSLYCLWMIQGVVSLPKIPAGHVTSCQIQILILILEKCFISLYLFLFQKNSHLKLQLERTNRLKRQSQSFCLI